jgi:HEPN domain-containing protein
MDDSFSAKDWLNRATSNLTIAKTFDINNLPENIFIEDLCFELQQATEKTIKAVLVHNDIEFPKIHDISKLLLLLKKKTTTEIPDNVGKASRLTQYAIKTRYPHWNKIPKENYIEALEITNNVYNWAKKIIKE